MDNDNNDSQNQYRHLASEENNKFSPVLPLYALPIFGFDDNLHGHLRFDSLVETEVFLDIESSVDNQWIEDFSRGSTGIPFSSSAAESCSISRRNNVWSEAASSESVEMLLKSVGQDETIPVQTTCKDSGACDELGCITNQMESSLAHGDSGLSKVVDDLQPALQSGVCPGKFSGLRDDSGDHQLVEDVSQRHESVISVDGALQDRNTDLPVAGRDKSKECTVVNENLVEASIDQSVDKMEQEDKCCSGSQVDTVVPSVQNTHPSSILLDSQDTTHLKNDIIDEDVKKLARENVDMSQEIQSDGVCPGKFSGLRDDTGDHRLVEDVSQRYESITSVDGALQDRNTDLPVNGRNESKECTVNENLVEASIDQSVDKTEQEDKCCSGSQVDTVVPSVQKTHPSSALVDSQDTTHLKNDIIDEDVKNLAREHVDMSQEVQSDGVCPGKFSGLRDDTGDHRLVEDVSQRHESVTSVDGALRDRNTDLSVAGRDESKECTVVNENLVEASVDQSVDKMEQEDKCCSGSQVDTVVPSVQNTHPSSILLDCQDTTHLKNDTLDEDVKNLVRENVDMKQEVQYDGVCPAKFFGLRDDTGDHRLVEDVSQRHGSVSSVDGALQDRNTDLPVIGRDESKESTVVNENLVEASIDPSVDKTEQEDKCCSGSQVDTVVPSVQNTHPSSALVDSQDTTHLKNDIIDGDVKNLARENVDTSQEVHSDGENLSENAVASVTSLAQKHSASDVQSKEDGHAVGNIVTAGEPVDRILKGNSDLHMVERCSKGLCVESPLLSGISKDIVFSEGKLHDISPLPFVGDVSNTDARNSSNLDSMVRIACDTIEKKNFLENDCHPDMKILSSKSDESSVVDDNDSKGESEDSHGTLRAKPVKDCKESIVTELNDDYKAYQSVSAAEDQNTKLSSDCSNAACADGVSVPVIKGVDSSVTGASDELASNLQPDVAISGNSMECVLFTSGKGLPVATADAFDQNEVQMPFAEASFSSMKASVMTSEKGPPCETGGQSCNKVDQSSSMKSIDEVQPGDQVLHGASLVAFKDMHISHIASDSTVRGTDGAEAQAISTSGSSEAAGSVLIQENNQTLTTSLPSTSKKPHDADQNHPEDSDPKLVTKDNICGHVVMHHIDGSVSMQENDQPFTNSLPSTSKEPSHDAGQNHPEDSDPKLVAKVKISGHLSLIDVDDDHAKTHSSSFPAVPSLESQTKIHSMESRSTTADLDNPCDSMIVIRTSDQSQSKIEKDGVKGSKVQSASVSGVINGEENKVQSISEDKKRNDASPGDGTFTFEVPPLADLSKKEAGKNLQLFSFMQHETISSVVEGTPSTSSLCKVGPKASQEASLANLQASESENAHGCSKGASERQRSGSKGTSERRTRRVGGKSAGKEATKKGVAAKEMTPKSRSKKSDRTSNASPSSAGSQVMQSNESQHWGKMEGDNMKPFGVLSTSASSLPDLNSASSPAAFHQHFKDTQQVQLRAQILVYGALIQGTAPDEAYMISAFGGPDGGRTIWENVWRACIDRVHSQQSHLLSPETPLQMHLGAKTSDQSIKQNAVQNKVTSSPASRSTSKGTPTTIVKPMIPLSSPLWSMPTPSCDVIQRSAVTDYQQALSSTRPTPIRNFVGHHAPWMSQSPFRVPWVPQTSFDGNARFPVLPITETVNLTPVREASVPHSSAMKQVSTVPMVQSSNPANVFVGTPLLDTKKATETRGQQFADPKPRKRKKSTVSEDPGQIILHSQTESVSAIVVTSNASIPSAITTPATIVSKSSTDKFVSSAYANHLEKGERDSDQRVPLSEDTFGKLQEVQKQAEDASALAAAAVQRSQEMWNQLAKHKKYRLKTDLEGELASAAVAIAAAAAVAKAAAAAAKVASNAALQAKLMADEALVLSDAKSSIPINAIASDNVKKLGKATPASILKGEDATTSSNSVIIAAREAARKKVEAALAASKRAENMDAIVKAAELAAEAVAQAGKIVAMGEPFPLTKLVEASPEAYWKVPQASLEPNVASREHIDKGGGVEDSALSARHPKEVLLDKREKPSGDYGMSPTLREVAGESLENDSSILVPAAISEKDKKGQKSRKVSEIAKTKVVTSESDIGLGSPSMITQTEHGEAGEISKNNNLREGSPVEVLRDGDGLKVAWFLADILDLKDGKAYVCYNELRSEDGDKLKEWVEFEGEGNRAPRIRAARPITAMPFEGTRKRRRAAMGDYNWSVGDRVDTWMQDSWWEGVVTEKSQKDETSFTVHFPARGETSVVKAWFLRPSLTWKNASWVEWSNSQDNNGFSHEGDTPQEKRPRIDNTVVEAKGEDTTSKNFNLEDSWKPDDNEKIFNIGKSSKDESKPDSLRTIRTGLKKEGSRVIFGVPKPGKKRKFMEVSKHYDADQSSKTHETSDSAKGAKYLMPHRSEPHGTKSKIEPRDKPTAVYKSKVLKSGKPPSVSSRTFPKDSLSRNVVTESGDSVAADVSRTENISGKRNKTELRSFSSSVGAAKGPFVFSSKAISSNAPLKKTSTSSAKSERISKPKLASTAGKLAKIEEEKGFNGNSMKTISELEPRRSNRRIQPTSRLLEGLQSSLIVSKIPSVSNKSQSRGTRGNNQG